MDWFLYGKGLHHERVNDVWIACDTKAYLSPWKTSKMELFSNILIIFEKISIIDMRWECNIHIVWNSTKKIVLLLTSIFFIFLLLAIKSSRFTGEYPCRRVILITLWHGYMAVDLLHIFRTPFLKNTSGWLLL